MNLLIWILLHSIIFCILFWIVFNKGHKSPIIKTILFPVIYLNLDDDKKEDVLRVVGAIAMVVNLIIFAIGLFNEEFRSSLHFWLW
jgi:nucleoside recognition membrane protein YjiH